MTNQITAKKKKKEKEKEKAKIITPKVVVPNNSTV